MAEKKVVEITSILHPREEFIIVDEDDNAYYITEEELLALFPEKILLKLEPDKLNKDKTWAKIML